MKTKKLTPLNVAPVKRENVGNVSVEENLLVTIEPLYGQPTDCFPMRDPQTGGIVTVCNSRPISQQLSDPFAGNDAQ